LIQFRSPSSSGMRGSSIKQAFDGVFRPGETLKAIHEFSGSIRMLAARHGDFPFSRTRSMPALTRTATVRSAQGSSTGPPGAARHRLATGGYGGLCFAIVEARPNVSAALSRRWSCVQRFAVSRTAASRWTSTST
jgi:hypothetical protein